MEGSEEGDGAGCETVVELGGVGHTRRHSVPLVKLVASTTPLSDVIIPNVITDQLSDVIPEPTEVTIHPSGDVTLGHKASIIVKQEGGPSLPPSITNKIITLSTTTSSTAVSTKPATIPITITTPTYRFEQDWRDAACDPVLTVSCKKTTAELVKGKFGSGSRGKCIRVGKQWFTPTEFEAHCGRSASKDWKRSIRFQGQSLLTLVEEGYLQVHATSCSCGSCLDDDAAAGSVRLHRPYKRKKRDRFFLDADKALKHDITSDHGTPASATPTTTVTLPVSELGDLTVVPGIIIGEQPPPAPTTPPAATATTVTEPSTATPTLMDPASLPLDKAWEHMNEVLMGLERSVGEARVLLGALRERTQHEGLTARHKLLQEKEEAEFDAQFPSITKSSEGFLVQVREDEGSPSLQPIMLDSLISNVPSLSPAPPINGVRKKCVNCNRESELECSGCQNRAYCGDFCQRRDWVNHQGECGRTTPTSEDPLSVTHGPPGYIFMLSD